MKKDFNEYELNYINFNHQDDSANVYFKRDEGGYIVYAKPVKGSKSAYKFPQKDEFNAYKLASALMDLSVGYAFELRSTKSGKNVRVIATPKTSDATIKLLVEDRVLAAELVTLLRKQEVEITKKQEENKNRYAGTTLIRAKIGENLVKAEEESKTDSLISVMLDRQFDLEDENRNLQDRNTILKKRNQEIKELVEKATKQTYYANNNLNSALNKM